MAEIPPGKSRSSRNRRHITMACGPCRTDKIKCDGASPVCRQCASKHRDRDCTYSFVDKRKKAVEVYSQRVRQLEAFIVQNNLDVPPVSQSDKVLLAQINTLYDVKSSYSNDSRPTISNASSDKQADVQPSLDTAAISTSITTDIPQPMENWDQKSSSPSCSSVPAFAPLNLHSSGIEADSADSTTIDFNFPGTELPLNHTLDVDWVWNHSLMPQIAEDLDVGNFNLPLLTTDVPFRNIGTKGPSPYPSPSTPPAIENDDEDDYFSTEEDEDHSALTNQLSARLGSLLTNEHGERHFYGATSILNLGRDKVVSSPFATMNYQGSQKRVVRLESVGLNQFISNDILDHLIDLFFTWHNPNMFTVDRTIFNKAREQYQAGDSSTSFFSLFLLDAMCAVGALFETRKHPSLPYPLTEFFAARATSVLDLEMEQPHVATVQALAVLSSHEAACTRDSQGWMFSGMAVRIAIDLGLHVSAKTYVDVGSMSVEEARGRSVAFWGAFYIDRLWSLYLGRPSYNILQAVTAETPMTFFTVQTLCTTGARKDLGDNFTDPQETMVEQWIKLLRIMSALEGSLYFEADASNIELQKLAEDTWNRLRSWRRNLPPDVNLDTDGPLPTECSPDIFILHMLYEYLTIVLHRPFVAKHYIQPNPLVGKGPQHARKMCVESACRISTLLSWYKCRCTLTQINIQVVQFTFSAALILVYATVSENDPQIHQQLSGHLEMCCMALAHFGGTFANATRTLDVLLHVKRTWQARLVAAAAGTKRHGIPLSSRSKTRQRRDAASSLGAFA